MIRTTLILIFLSSCASSLRPDMNSYSHQNSIAERNITNTGLAQNSFDEDVEQVTPVEVEVAQAFFNRDKLNVKVVLKTLKDFNSDEIVLGILGLKQGEIVEQSFKRVKDVIGTSSLEPDTKVVARFELQSNDLTEYQVSCTWGNKAKQKWASVNNRFSPFNKQNEILAKNSNVNSFGNQNLNQVNPNTFRNRSIQNSNLASNNFSQGSTSQNFLNSSNLNTNNITQSRLAQNNLLLSKTQASQVLPGTPPQNNKLHSSYNGLQETSVNNVVQNSGLEKQFASNSSSNNFRHGEFAQQRPIEQRIEPGIEQPVQQNVQQSNIAQQNNTQQARIQQPNLKQPNLSRAMLSSNPNSFTQNSLSQNNVQTQQAVNTQTGQLEIKNLDVIAKELSCGRPPCKLIYTVVGKFQNDTANFVKAANLAVGLHWVNTGQLPNLPKGSSQINPNEEVLSVGLNLEPGNSKEFSIKLDKEVPQIPGGSFIPHVRLVRHSFR